MPKRMDTELVGPWSVRFGLSISTSSLIITTSGLPTNKGTTEDVITSFKLLIFQSQALLERTRQKLQ
jgi:hypothetical protein